MSKNENKWVQIILDTEPREGTHMYTATLGDWDGSGNTPLEAVARLAVSMREHLEELGF